MTGPTELRLFMVEHDLRDLTSQQQSSAHQSLGEAVRRVARRGSRIRYVQRILIPEESRCLCLFEAAGADVVRNANDIAQFPLTRIITVRSSVNPARHRLTGQRRKTTHPTAEPDTGLRPGHGPYAPYPKPCQPPGIRR